MSDIGISAARRFSWSVRRELWEYRSIYLAPAAVGGLVLVGFFIALGSLPARMRAAQSLAPDQLRATIEQPYLIAALLLMAAEMVVAILYCLDALYGERRDRSVLFWKSLPVSDVTAVLAKASIPILALPIVTFVVTVATQSVMLLASTMVLSATGLGISTGWNHVSLFEFSRINFGHLVVYHGLWYAPVYAWLLLVSAWATRVPLLWALLPPVAVAIVERLAFSSTWFVGLLRALFLPGGESGDVLEAPPEMTLDMLGASESLSHLLMTPALWIALAVSVFLLLGVVRVRRSRGAM
jgi:ABC-2 type transport system permease protein